jgi:two-component system OmpR family sensor kinase
VLVDEPVVERGSRRSLQAGFEAFGITALVGGAIFAAPAVIVASVLGVRRARAISQPMKELSSAASALAGGDLTRRVPVAGRDEVSALGISFNAMADQLAQTLKAETELREQAERALTANRSLVANVSHELRTPVAVVQAHLERLQGGAGDGVASAEIALRETERLSRLVDDLFVLAQLEDQGIQLSDERFDVGRVVVEAVRSLRELARREKQISVLAETPQAPLIASGDPERLVGVLQNLIRNATRHTPEGGLIRVAARDDEDGPSVRVSDTGPGVPRELVPRVFERFVRGDDPRTREQGGAGLGLAIARETMRAMGGDLQLDQQPDEGATFILRLRRAAPNTGP